ncbi:MAG: glycosyltransferase family 2 protein [Acidimicrobiia bacterium]|nr:glycosyltransferase family 2 protein [Acidimicrobiia bacterium]
MAISLPACPVRYAKMLAAGPHRHYPQIAKRLELCVVMPVYNEQEIIRQVVSSWLQMLDEQQVNYELLAIVDGGTDASEAILLEMAAEHPRLVVDTKPNSGHGPTILQGYRRGVDNAEWVFQTDSDNEMPAGSFSDLWELRRITDAVIGIRMSRRQSLGRRVITLLARLTVRAVFGCRIADVNCPYRLMRSKTLAPLLDLVPDYTFAPNVALSGMLARSGARLVEVPVPHHERTTGVVSILGWRVVRTAFRSFVQVARLSRVYVPSTFNLNQ